MAIPDKETKTITRYTNMLLLFSVVASISALAISVSLIGSNEQHQRLVALTKDGRSIDITNMQASHLSRVHLIQKRVKYVSDKYGN